MFNFRDHARLRKFFTLIIYSGKICAREKFSNYGIASVHNIACTCCMVFTHTFCSCSQEKELVPADDKIDRSLLEGLVKRRFYYGPSFSIYGGTVCVLHLLKAVLLLPGFVSLVAVS